MGQIFPTGCGPFPGLSRGSWPWVFAAVRAKETLHRRSRGVPCHQNSLGGAALGKLSSSSCFFSPDAARLYVCFADNVPRVVSDDVASDTDVSYRQLRRDFELTGLGTRNQLSELLHALTVHGLGTESCKCLLMVCDFHLLRAPARARKEHARELEV